MTSPGPERARNTAGAGAVLIGTGRARYRRILRFAARHLAATWWWEIFLPRIGLSRLSERTRTRRMQRIARSFHNLALDLGG